MEYNEVNMKACTTAILVKQDLQSRMQATSVEAPRKDRLREAIPFAGPLRD
jgi:hypothetical protein